MGGRQRQVGSDFESRRGVEDNCEVDCGDGDEMGRVEEAYVGSVCIVDDEPWGKRELRTKGNKVDFTMRVGIRLLEVRVVLLRFPNTGDRRLRSHPRQVNLLLSLRLLLFRYLPLYFLS